MAQVATKMVKLMAALTTATESASQMAGTANSVCNAVTALTDKSHETLMGLASEVASIAQSEVSDFQDSIRETEAQGKSLEKQCSELGDRWKSFEAHTENLLKHAEIGRTDVQECIRLLQLMLQCAAECSSCYQEFKKKLHCAIEQGSLLAKRCKLGGEDARSNASTTKLLGYGAAAALATVAVGFVIFATGGLGLLGVAVGAGATASAAGAGTVVGAAGAAGAVGAAGAAGAAGAVGAAGAGAAVGAVGAAGAGAAVVGAVGAAGTVGAAIATGAAKAVAAGASRIGAGAVSVVAAAGAVGVRAFTYNRVSQLEKLATDFDCLREQLNLALRDLNNLGDSVTGLFAVTETMVKNMEIALKFFKEQQKLQQEKDRLQLESDRHQQEKDQLQLENDRHQQEKDLLQLENDRHQQEKDQLQLENDRHQQEKDQLQLENDRLQQEKDKMEQENERARLESEETMRRLEELERLVRELKGGKRKPSDCEN